MCDPVSMMAVGTAVAAGGQLIGGIGAKRDADALAAQQREQARVEALIGAVEDERTRARLRSSIGEMRAQLAARGVALDSPSAIALGETAAREMSFESQSTRSRTAARTAELTTAARQSRAYGARALLTGVTNAAGAVLARAPDIWPSLRAGA